MTDSSYRPMIGAVPALLPISCKPSVHRYALVSRRNQFGHTEDKGPTAAGCRVRLSLLKSSCLSRYRPDWQPLMASDAQLWRRSWTRTPSQPSTAGRRLDKSVARLAERQIPAPTPGFEDQGIGGPVCNFGLEFVCERGLVSRVVIPFSPRFRSNNTSAEWGLLNLPVNCFPLSANTSEGTS
jgi:hypothetical protein